jgi:hypothetical protein
MPDHSTDRRLTIGSPETVARARWTARLDRTAAGFGPRTPADADSPPADGARVTFTHDDPSRFF